MSQAHPAIRGGLPTWGACSPYALCTTLLVTWCHFPCRFFGSPSFSLCPRPRPAAPPWCPVWGCVVCGGGGVVCVGVDASIGPRPPAFPLVGADVCTPRWGVTLLYGPSICTRFVQVDLRRS